MSNNLNINLKFDDFGNPECFSDDSEKFDSSLKLKINALAKNILQEAQTSVDQIHTISIKTSAEDKNASVISLQKGDVSQSLENSIEITKLTKEILKEKDIPFSHNIIFNIQKRIPEREPILPNIVNTPRPLSDRIMAHIHADEFGKSSELEGNQSIQILNFLHDFLCDRDLTSNPYGISNQLSGQLVDAIAYDMSLNDPYAISNQIGYCLDKNKPLLMTGGWTGSPDGHAIYYELVPEPDNKATFRLYNIGAGTKENVQITEGLKEKAAPMVEWQGIHREILRNIAFSKVLHEHKTDKNIPGTMESTSYEGKDIYGALRELLNPEREEIIFSREGESISMTPQRAGMCTWKSLTAFLRTKMDTDQYKIFKCDIKLQSLIDSYNFIDPDRKLSEDAHWRLIQKSLAKTCRSIDKLYESGAVGEEYVLKAHELLRPVHQWVKANESSTLKNDTIPDVQQLEYQPPGVVKWAAGWGMGDDEPLNSIKGGEGCLQRKEGFTDELKKIQSKTLEAVDINPVLDTFLPMAKQMWLDHFDQESHIGLTQLISMFPIDSTFWVEAVGNDPKQAEALILRLGELQALYFKTCWTTPSANIVFLERELGMSKLSYIMNHLAKVIAPQQWMDITPLGRKMVSFESHLMNSKEEKAWGIIQNWSGRDRNKLFSLINSKEKSFPGFFQAGIVTNSYSRDEKPVDRFRQIDPELEKKIQSDNPSFAKMEKNKQDACIYTSPHLKPWIRAIIDGCSYANCLEEELLYNPGALDRNHDLTLISEINQDKNIYSNVYVTWKLKGIYLSDQKKREDNKFGFHLERDEKFFSKSEKNKYYLSLLKKLEAGYERFLVNENTLKKPKEESVNRLKTRVECEEFKEFGYVLLGDELVSPLHVVSMLSLFEDHPEHIFDIDYQVLFETFVFRIDCMDSALKLEGMKDKLINFIEANVERALSDNQIQTTAFLARISRHVQKYLPEPDPRLQELQLPLLRKLLENKNLDVNHKGLIYAEICANLSHKDELNNREIEELLIGTAFVGRYPVQQNWTNQYVTRDIGIGLVKHASQFEALLVQNGVPNQQLLNKILKELDPTAEEETWLIHNKEGEYPRFSTDSVRYEYYPWLGNFLSLGIEARLPDNITKTEEFKKLFPTVKKGLQLEGNVFAFKDSENIETRVRKEGNYLTIDQLRGDPKKWYRFFPKDSLIDKPYAEQPFTPIYSRHLTGHYDTWQDVSAWPIELLLVDPITKQEKYICTFAGKRSWLFKVDAIRRIHDGALLGASSQLMSAVEEAPYIHEWYKDGKLAEVELPRYSLNFKVDSTDANKLSCDQFPGFFLKPGELLKKLGAYRHYLVLEDAHGNQKVIMPIHHFKDVETKEVFEPRYEIDMNVEDKISRPQQIHVFEVMKNGKLFSKSREANFYLAEVSLLVQNYKEAAALLKQFGTKLRAYTPAEVELLQKISCIDTITGNIEGNAIGIQMYAFYLLEKNCRDFPKEVSQKKLSEKGEFAKRYGQYLNHLNAIQELRLSKEEELYLIKSLKPTEVINHRLEQLRGIKTPHHEASIQISSENLNFNDLTVEGFEQQNDKKEISTFNLSSLTRGSVMLKRMKITTLYWKSMQLKKDGSYRTALIYWKHHAKSPNEKMKANLLMLILDHQDKFPSIPSNLNEDNFDLWWSKVIEIANDVAKEFPPVQPIKKAIIAPPKKKISSSTPSRIKIPVAPLQLQPIAPFREKEIVGDNQDAWFSKTEQPITPRGITADKESIPNILDQLVKISTGDDQKPDPLITKEVDRISKDFVAYDKQTSTPYYRLNDNALNEIEAFCRTKNDFYREEINTLEREILALVRQSPVTKFGIARKDLQTWGGKQKPLKMDELIVNFAKQDPAVLKARNPALSIADVQEIYEKIGTYLQLYTQRQQAQRALVTLNKINTLKLDKNGNSDVIEDLVQKLANDLTATRCYTLADQPAFLVFEYFADIVLRPQQVNMISDFLTGGDKQAIRELIMGSGKSKVLMPLLALLRADGKNISAMIVPQDLFQSISSDTQSTLKDAFDVSLHTLEFDRSTTFDIETLSNIQEELESIKDNKEALIITSKSVQCLLLEFIEKAEEHFRDSSNPVEMTPELKLMAEILRTLSQSLPLLDEADLLLNVLHEVSFSLGQGNKPIAQECELITDLYTILYNDPAIKKLARIESDPEGFPDAPILTESLYHTAVKKPLAEAFIERMKTKEFDDKKLQKKVNAYFGSLKSTERDLVLDYLCRFKGKEKAAQEYYDQQPEEIREILAMAGEEISSLFPHSLTRPCDEKYGLDEKAKGILAIPFSAAKTPSHGSEFASHHITMNYTLQTYVKKGIPKHILESQLKILQTSARREIRDSNGEMDLKETLAWKSFCRIKGEIDVPLFNLNEEQFDLILNEVNRNTVNRLKMVQFLILPQIVIFDSKISSNSHNLVSLFKILSGFTGTLWNSASMHRNLTPQPTEGTDALTISKLWKNSYDAIHTIPIGTDKEMMGQIKDKVGSFDLLADAGGYFKDKDNFSNAKLLANTMNKPAVFYNHHGDQTIWEGKGKGEVPFSESRFKEQEDQRVTFLDQSHTTGADVTQKPRAVGVVTIGPHMLLRDLLQSVWRLRGLEKSQKVEFIVLEDVETVIRQTLKKEGGAEKEKLSFADILSFVIINQAKQQGRDNFKAYHAELNEIFQKAFLDVLLNPRSTPQQCAEIVKKLGSTWIKPSFATAGTLYGQIPLEEDSDVVRKKILEQSIKTAESQGLHSLVEEMKKVSERFEKSLPPTGSTKVGNEELTCEQEQQKIGEKQTELESATALETREIQLGQILETEDLETFTPDKFVPELYPKNIRGYSAHRDLVTALEPRISNPLPIFPVALFFEEYEEFKPYVNTFEGVDISLGMLQIIDKKNVALSDIALFGQYRKPIKYVMIEKDKITLLNHEEASKRIAKDYTNVYELTVGYVNSKDKIDEETAQKLTKIKFLAGKSNYSRQELEFLRKWIEKEGVEKMHDLFCKHILKGQVLQSIEYEQSSLKKLFQSF